MENLKKRSHNLFMVKVYWQIQNEISIAEQISEENRIKINSEIDAATILIQVAREKLHSIERLGGEHTQGIWSEYQKLDKVMEEIRRKQTKVNNLECDLNLKDYPV